MREFNITGTCIPEYHYMVNIDDKLKSIISMIDEGSYFVINKPRQYGKTTTLSQIRRRLYSQYAVISISFEDQAGEASCSENEFIYDFIDSVNNDLLESKVDEKIINNWYVEKSGLSLMRNLSNSITRLVNMLDKDVVLLIDEVDASSGNKAFIKFLGMLRSKYLSMRDGRGKTFKSVILAGVRDIKNLRLKIKSDDKHVYNSPWNIAADFDVNMSFSPEEISTMLSEYEKDHHTGMDINFISKEIYKFTSGYPFLVSYICKMIDEELDKNWSLEGIENAVKIFLNEKTTLSDDVIKNIENNEDLYDTVYGILVLLEKHAYISSELYVEKGIMYGILSVDENNDLKISNKMFEIYLYRHFANKKRRTSELYSNLPTSREKYVVNGNLDMPAVIDGFKRFMESQSLNKDGMLLERECRLIFLSYLMPIINGSGFFYIEAETGDDKRIDVIVTYGKEEFIIELKLWHGISKHEDAYDQLVNYLNLRKRDAGYLLTFSFTEGKSKSEWIEYEDKRIYDVIIQMHPNKSPKLKELKSLTLKAEEVKRELDDALESVKALKDE